MSILSCYLEFSSSQPAEFLRTVCCELCLACSTLTRPSGILQRSLEPAALIVGIESAELIGGSSLQASVKFRLILWNVAGIFGVFVESLCLCVVFAEVFTKKTAKFAVFSKFLWSLS